MDISKAITLYKAYKKTKEEIYHTQLKLKSLEMTESMLLDNIGREIQRVMPVGSVIRYEGKRYRVRSFSHRQQPHVVLQYVDDGFNEMGIFKKVPFVLLLIEHIKNNNDTSFVTNTVNINERHERYV